MGPTAVSANCRTCDSDTPFFTNAGMGTSPLPHTEMILHSLPNSQHTNEGQRPIVFTRMSWRMVSIYPFAGSSILSGTPTTLELSSTLLALKSQLPKVTLKKADSRSTYKHYRHCSCVKHPVQMYMLDPYKSGLHIREAIGFAKESVRNSDILPVGEICNVAPQKAQGHNGEKRVGNKLQQAQIAPLQQNVCKRDAGQHNSRFPYVPPQEQVLDCKSNARAF